MKEIEKNIIHYLPLLGIFISVVIAFWLFSYDKFFQVIIFTAAALTYIAWGLIHHYAHKDLSSEVIIEYIVVAALGLTIVFSVIL